MEKRWMECECGWIFEIEIEEVGEKNCPSCGSYNLIVEEIK